MSKHFERDIENLQRGLLTMSGRVEEMVGLANRALCERNSVLAQRVIESDAAVDEQEVRLEEECLKILALHQPVAIDLRRVATVMKVNNDLERIADLAVNVAQRTKCLVEEPEFPIPLKLDRMADLARTMLRDSLDALVDLDESKARLICQTDDEVDELNRQIIDELQVHMREQSVSISAALHCFSATRHMERIADHATNIAEDVIYLVSGEIARHKSTHLTSSVSG
ncbi:MAG: phosphate signaling complex protein PhoU [Pirellulales bacterium]|nr:phosphate signaling complex protein PhoU [Pirellulales bacterium]